MKIRHAALVLAALVVAVAAGAIATTPGKAAIECVIDPAQFIALAESKALDGTITYTEIGVDNAGIPCTEVTDPSATNSHWSTASEIASRAFQQQLTAATAAETGLTTIDGKTALVWLAESADKAALARDNWPAWNQAQRDGAMVELFGRFAKFFNGFADLLRVLGRGE